MLTNAQARERSAAVERVADFMKRNGVRVADLVTVGGADLNADPIRAEKARRVERAWSLIAKLGLDFAALDESSSIAKGSGQSPTFEPEVDQARGVARKSLNTHKSSDRPEKTINEQNQPLSLFGLIEEPQRGRIEKIEREQTTEDR